jgi:hypothetical protein
MFAASLHKPGVRKCEFIKAVANFVLGDTELT